LIVNIGDEEVPSGYEAALPALRTRGNRADRAALRRQCRQERLQWPCAYGIHQWRRNLHI